MATVTIPINWQEWNGYECPFCGGKISSPESNPNAPPGYIDDEFMCDRQGGEMCSNAVFVRRYTRGSDSIEISAWIEISIDDRYVSETTR